MKKGKLYWVTVWVCATYVFCLAILATGLGISAAAPPFSFPDSNSTQLVSSPVDTNWWRAPRGVTTNKAIFASVSAANSIAYKEFTSKHAFHVSIALNIINVLEKKSVSYFLQQAPCSLRHRIRALTILHDTFNSSWLPLTKWASRRWTPWRHRCRGWRRRVLFCPHYRRGSRTRRIRGHDNRSWSNRLKPVLSIQACVPVVSWATSGSAWYSL